MRRGRVLARRRLESALDRAVREHRFTIAVVFPLVGAGLFLAELEGLVPRWPLATPVLLLVGVAVMRSPLVAGLAPLVTRRAATSLLAVTAYTYAIEWVGITTGFPYGHFVYERALGPMLFDSIPLALPLFFLPLVLNAYLLSLLVLGPTAASPIRRGGLALALVLLVDLVLDPAAVALGFWRYLDGGVYYGVPLSNFAGWLLSGTVALLAIEYGFDWRDLRERLRTCPYLLDDLVSFTVLWGLVNVYVGNWGPVVLTTVLVAGLARADWFDLALPSWSERA